MDGGWFDCGQVLYGDTISIYRTDASDLHYNLWTMRAYEGTNVLKDATVFAEPAEHTATESASNLLWQYPRTSDLTRRPYSNPSGTVDPSIYSCSKHTGQAGK